MTFAKIAAWNFVLKKNWRQDYTELTVRLPACPYASRVWKSAQGMDIARQAPVLRAAGYWPAILKIAASKTVNEILAPFSWRSRSAPLSVLQIFRSVVDDPVARAAPAPADIIDRPNFIVAPNQTANNNPLKRNGDVDHSRTAGSSRSVCSAQLGRTARWNRRAPCARVRAAIAVNAVLVGCVICPGPTIDA